MIDWPVQTTFGTNIFVGNNHETLFFFHYIHKLIYYIIPYERREKKMNILS